MSQIPTEPHVGEQIPAGFHGNQTVAVEPQVEHSVSTRAEPHVEPQVPPEVCTKQHILAQSQGGLIQVDNTSTQSDFDDETNYADSSGSSLASVTLSILCGKVDENKRTYAVYDKEEYGFPMAEPELDRIDMCHTKYYALLEKKRFLVPIPKNPHKILDL